MATNTPNWNLSKPENTDTQSSFISDYCGNMDIIDQHLGSGGGGGNVAVLGAFVDTDNSTFITINDGSIVYSTYSYTATDDCYVDLLLQGNAGGTIFVKIDGKTIYQHLQTPVFLTDIFLLKKGQVLTLENLQAYSYMTIYGVVQGSKSIVAPIIYSDTEREVGTWRDNKPLYQRTFHATGYNVGSTPQTLLAINDIPFDYVAVIEQSVYDPNDDRIYEIPNMSSYSGGRIFGHCYLNKALNPVVFYGLFYTGGETYPQLDFSITLQYTKTTDTAGSGNWNVDGVPMHHYSTSEQVVGSWIDNKPLYEITIEADNPTAYVIGSRKYIEVPYNINVIDFAKCVNCTIYDSTDGRWYSLPYQRITSSENIDVMEMSKSDGSYVITAHWATSNAYNITKVRYTVQYTKTTD